MFTCGFVVTLFLIVGLCNLSCGGVWVNSVVINKLKLYLNYLFTVLYWFVGCYLLFV